MSDRRGDADAAHVGAPTLRWPAVVVTVVLAGLAGLAAWFAVGAVSAAEPHGYLMAPPTDIAPVPGVSTPLSLPADAEHVDATATNAADASGTGASTATSRSIADRVDVAWAARTSTATGIPLRVLRGYAGAELALAAEAPGCGIRWNTLAALGRIESSHGTYGGSVVDADGVTRPGIFGIDLAGEASARVSDTDGGRWDGKADIDRAVGPLQFIPATWETWGADGDGDGVRDAQQIDDAALAAARYLCHHGDLRSADAWRAAVFAYNRLDSYVDAVAHAADEYAGRAAG
ncbi:membrane-bound lytic murein transglycosylase B [Microbacterium trichothecenolyticum]|uniref:lytic transglycosylase domain-containing protein n=1 Tax=Microbacterium trichothecenolyticum TaxID=69370 RepID=UPI0028660396|nr:lytic transglycosylase domain-containing protein [Microbacterium trichothecenolyticum]MDR7182992.1 membrane-bound lytic murein transglycosylase B [Microbacterium trichothecenolyticum]